MNLPPTLLLDPHTEPDPNNPARILLSRANLKTIGIRLSNSQLLRLEALGRFPRRIRISAATVCWDRAEIAEWLEARMTERAHWHYADGAGS